MRGGGGVFKALALLKITHFYLVKRQRATLLCFCATDDGGSTTDISEMHDVPKVRGYVPICLHVLEFRAVFHGQRSIILQ